MLAEVHISLLWNETKCGLKFNVFEIFLLFDSLSASPVYFQI